MKRNPGSLLHQCHLQHVTNPNKVFNLGELDLVRDDSLVFNLVMEQKGVKFRVDQSERTMRIEHLFIERSNETL